MPKRQFLTAALLICATAATAHSENSGIDCAAGELTLSRLAESECVSRIPLPTARPTTVAAANLLQVDEPQEWDFIETPAGSLGETRMVRVVGSRFLPDPGEKIDFRTHSSSQAGLLDAAFHRAAAYVGFATPAPQPVAVDDEAQIEVVQEASADFDSLALRN